MLTQEIKNEILSLNSLDKIHLAEMIFDSLDKPYSSVEKIWVNESEKDIKLISKTKSKVFH
jgi:hypothetical protein